MNDEWLQNLSRRSPKGQGKGLWGKATLASLRSRGFRLSNGHPESSSE